MMSYPEEDVVEMLTRTIDNPFWIGNPAKQAVNPKVLKRARARILKLEAELWEATELSEKEFK